MNLPSTTLTSEQLYPPTIEPGLWKMVLAIATPIRDKEGNFELVRTLEPFEKDAITARLRELARWFEPGDKRKIVTTVTNTILGFSAGGKTVSLEEAKAIATQYVVDLAGLPFWAIARSCQRFGQGSVRPDEVGARKLDPAYPPSAAQIRIIAVAVLRQFGEERTRLRMTLNGTVPYLATPEERERALESIAAWREQQGLRQKDEDAAEKAARRERDLKDIERAHARIRQSYRDAGLPPPLEREGKALVSLEMLLSMGWTIQNVGDGKSVLIAPPPVVFVRRETEGS